MAFVETKVALATTYLCVRIQVISLPLHFGAIGGLSILRSFAQRLRNESGGQRRAVS
jgi:hypothetical protein